MTATMTCRKSGIIGTSRKEACVRRADGRPALPVFRVPERYFQKCGGLKMAFEKYIPAPGFCISACLKAFYHGKNLTERHGSAEQVKSAADGDVDTGRTKIVQLF